MNSSERKTYLSSLQFFLEPFTYHRLKYKTFNGEEELCDVLIEYQNWYVTIEIKCREGDSINYKSWFKNKVRKKAIDQLKRDITVLNNPKLYYIFDEKKRKVTLEKRKYILPIVIFEKEGKEDYEKVFNSKRLGQKVSVFSMEDFQAAMVNLIVPSDIINYCLYRNEFFANSPTAFGTRLVQFETNHFMGLFGGGINNETDLSEFYVRSHYSNLSISLDKLRLYNYTLNEIYNHTPDEYRKDLVQLLMSTNIETACNVMDKWLVSMERCKSEEHYFPQTIEGFDEDLILFVTKARNDTLDKFDLFAKNLGEAYAFHFKRKRLYIIGFFMIKNITNIKILCADINLTKCNEQIQRNIDALWPKN